MIKTVIFDMDGLMIDSERVTFEGYQHELKNRGLTIDEDFYRTLLGKPVAGIHQRFYEVYGKDFPIEEIMKIVHVYMAERFETQGVPIKTGLIELLKYLKSNNYKTIIATSSQRARVDTILSLANLSQYFDASICGDEVSRGKPDPEVFLKACQKLQAEPQEALVIEDSEAGIEASYRANIKVICIPDMKYPEAEYENKAYKIMNDLNEVIEFMKKEY